MGVGGNTPEHEELGAFREFSSFRDPSGYLLWHNGEIHRFIDTRYARAFAFAQTAGLYTAAVDAGLLLPFEMVSPSHLPAGISSANCAALLKPQQLSMVSYPYEWSFEQLKDAAIATLRLHILALEKGALLKDASAYNVQFVGGRPTIIDHLSFDVAADHVAWPAYGQFCRHFLSPLLLMAYVDLSFARILQLYIDGPPLDLVCKLLPKRTLLSPGIQMHMHMHARVSHKYAGSRQKVVMREGQLSTTSLTAIASSLLRLVESLKPVAQATEWGEYYSDTNYSSEAFSAKKAMLRRVVEQTAARTIWDLGGNNGEFSRAVRDLAHNIVCMDVDPRAVQQNYIICRRENIPNILPIVVDLTNPPAAIGFDNKERRALFKRDKPDLVIVLALIHHLAITNNLPLDYIARFLARLAPNLVIEFVPKSDSQVGRLLANRPDIFPTYHQEGFVSAFAPYFHVASEERIPDTERTLYRMVRRDKISA